MPELPEVENVRGTLQALLNNHPQIVRFTFRRKDLRDPIPQSLLRQAEGKAVLAIRRRAKYLLIDTAGGSLLSHLGMTGSWRCETAAQPSSEWQTHDHVLIHLSDGRTLVYNDPRRFGILDWCATELEHPRLKDLGPEPLDKTFSGATLWHTLRGKTQAIKLAIMDQHTVVGVGNIYASEALFRCGVRPTLPASKLSLRRCESLVLAIKEILQESISVGGSTISDYRDANGKIGDFQSRFQVYDRAGEGCRRCQGKVRRKVLGGRSTFWCSSCQR